MLRWLLDVGKICGSLVFETQILYAFETEIQCVGSTFDHVEGWLLDVSVNVVLTMFKVNEFWVVGGGSLIWIWLLGSLIWIWLLGALIWIWLLGALIWIWLLVTCGKVMSRLVEERLAAVASHQYSKRYYYSYGRPRSLIGVLAVALSRVISIPCVLQM